MQVTIIECTECAGTVDAEPTLVGEILDCNDCGAELEVLRLSPIEIALAPDVQEDWGE